jgi:hypothetical protein
MRGFQTPPAGGIDISDATANASQVLNGDTFYAGTPPKKTGAMSTVSIQAGSNSYPTGYHAGDALGLPDIEPNLAS